MLSWRVVCGVPRGVGACAVRPHSMRLAMLAAFKNDPNVHAILLSLKAGGEGLNLQHASRTAYSRGALAQCCNAPPCVATGVFLMDPWWNPPSSTTYLPCGTHVKPSDPIDQRTAFDRTLL